MNITSDMPIRTPVEYVITTRTREHRVTASVNADNGLLRITMGNQSLSNLQLTDRLPSVARIGWQWEVMQVLGTGLGEVTSTIVGVDPTTL